MKYKYIYKTSDGTRREGKITASSREDVFAQLREQKIRPIKVLAEDGSLDNGAVNGVRKRVVITIAITAAVSTGAISYWMGRDVQPVSRTTLEDAASRQTAQPLARQQIQGDRNRIIYAQHRGLQSAVERYLSLFAEPGRSLPDSVDERPSDGEFMAFLSSDVTYASKDYTEIVDLKRIIAKIKNDLKSYLEAGGSVSEYCDELVKRQELERSYRVKADNRLNALLSEQDKNGLASAYDYFLRANAQLQSMGIFPLPLPIELRSYQQSIDFD